MREVELAKVGDLKDGEWPGVMRDNRMPTTDQLKSENVNLQELLRSPG